MKYFKTYYLEDVEKFLSTLDKSIVRKIVYNVTKAEDSNDSKLFKKINKDIWEFRTKFSGFQIRLLAFWDKSESGNTLVLATNGFVKKTDKTPTNEIDKAVKIRKKYFEDKSLLKNKLP